MKLPRVSRVDVLLSLLAAVLLQFEVWVFDPGPPALLRAILVLIAAGALAFMQPFPVAAYLTNGFAVYGLIAVGSPSDLYQWTNLIALVFMGALTPVRRGVVPMLLGLGGVAFYFLRFPDEGGVLSMVVVQSLYLAGYLGGTSQRARLKSERLESERDLAEARVAASQAEAALEGERSRMARELHDVVGHALTAMVVQAGAAERILDRDPAAARGALAHIANQGRMALEDMDRMLSFLHGESPRTRLPRLEDLETMVAGIAGLETKISLSGNVAKVPSSVSLTGYRIVQEALTNAIRHSQASLVTVDVQVDSDVRIKVTDDGVGGDPQAGRGLTGMIERAELHGGSIRFGPAAAGGFEVEVRLPVQD